ncbi:pyruvate kinase [Candidatus Neomarinimicrobiota bacterium]
MNTDRKGHRTKIIATMGPSSMQPGVLAEMLQAGMNVARINTSHADRQNIIDTAAHVRKVSEDEGVIVGILMDLAGPKIRVSDIPEAGINLSQGDELTLGTGSTVDVKVAPEMEYENVAENARVMLDDGRIELQVTEHLNSKTLRVEVIHGGMLLPNKGVNFPGVALSVPTVTENDKVNLRLALELDIDWIALSFVRSAVDRAPIDEIFKEVGKKIPVMAKIEKPEAVENLEAIIEAFEGAMVARGDLGVEMPLEQVPLIQKEIIRKCNAHGKPVITATQLLDSMVSSPSPTRAEANDVANAIFDGTDAVMLSNESAVGAYPVKAVATLASIAITTETAPIGSLVRSRDTHQELNIATAISHAASNIVRECDIPVIVTMSESGITARGVSRYRPRACIVALSPNLSTCRQLQLSWGVSALQIPRKTSTDDMLASAEKLLLEHNYISEGEYFVLTAGIPVGQAGTTNLLKVQQVGGS